MIIFAYDFPHRKTEDFIIYCYVKNIKIDAVIGTSWKKLNVSTPKFKTKVSVRPIYSPKMLCEKLKISYYNCEHNSDNTYNIIKKINPDIGMIAGARILSSRIIKLFNKGIINFHPGDIPKIRGLNSSLRAIKLKHPQVVTAHLIDEDIDSGIILLKKKIDMNPNDTLYDINEKLYRLQIDMIVDAIKKTNTGSGEKIKISNPYHYKTPFEYYDDFKREFKKYMK